MPRGDQESSFSPELGMCSGYVLWKVHCSALESMAPGVAVVLGDVLGLVEIAPSS